MVFTTANPDGVIAGFTEGYDANGLPVRGLTRCKKGDELIPIYPMLYDDGFGFRRIRRGHVRGRPDHRRRHAARV